MSTQTSLLRLAMYQVKYSSITLQSSFLSHVHLFYTLFGIQVKSSLINKIVNLPFDVIGF